MAIRYILTIACVIWGVQSHAQRQHPCLLLTPKGVQEVRQSFGKYPILDSSFKACKLVADKAVASEIILPTPKEGGGGYSHEKHKNNYYEMFSCGIIYQLTGDARYAEFVKKMLLNYAKIYKGLPLHPLGQSDSPGKLFWQTLNEYVWLVHTANAYDCVYTYIDPSSRQVIESNLFRPMVDFIVNGNEANSKIFNMMHNHGTWADASVGMIGYVMGDSDMVKMSLYGSNKDGNGGFLKQLNEQFSPTGYYTEGPYYQRYSIWPYVTFAQSIQNNQPELEIFAYRDSILVKAVKSLAQLTYNGKFFRLNDALEKGFTAQELIYAVDIVYNASLKDKWLLSLAKEQNQVLLNKAGVSVARGLSMRESASMKFTSGLFTDGAKGDKGAVAVLRPNAKSSTTALVFKATSHGLSHGHYDKLSISFYDNGHEILQDYGSARFVNVEAKSSGGYTKENKTWAMQTIAHNTVVVDSTSNFKGDIKESSKYAPTVLFYSDADENIKLASAVDSNAYPGVKMHRTVALMNNKITGLPLVVDLYRVESSQKHTYDYPFYYLGHMVSANFPYVKSMKSMRAFGTKNGYQHLWVEADGRAMDSTSKFTWLNGNRFYTISTISDAKDTRLINARIGANDMDYNLRTDPVFIVREQNADKHTFFSVLEAHGDYNLTLEQTSNSESFIKNLELLVDDEKYTVARIIFKDGRSATLCLANFKSKANELHLVAGSNHTEYKWQGQYNLLWD